MSIDASSPDTPPAPAIPLKNWQDGVAPAYIAAFLTVAFLDSQAIGTLFVGGLGPSLLGASVAGLFGYWMLYYAPARWGFSTRQPLAVVASSTFGSKGAPWVPGLLLGVANVIWFAVAVSGAASYSLSGLSTLGLLDQSYLPKYVDGRMASPGWVFIATTFAWAITSAILGTLAIRLVMMVMTFYPVFPALTFGAALVWAMKGIANGPIATVPWREGGGSAALTMLQFLFGFLSALGLLAVDWGAVTTTERDVRLGGLVGVTLAVPILSCLAMLLVAGAIGREVEATVPTTQEAPPPRPRGKVARTPRSVARPGTVRAEPTTLPSPPPRPFLTMRETFLRGMGGRFGGTALLIFSLSMLGPACYTPFLIARQFSAVWPKVPRWRLSIVGAIATWPLLATGWADQVDVCFGFLGGIAAPAVGAISADYALHRGRWPGSAPGIRWPGMIAWLVGMMVGLGPLIGRAAGLGSRSQYQPAAVFGFLAAFAVFLALAGAARLIKPPPAEVPAPT